MMSNRMRLQFKEHLVVEGHLVVLPMWGEVVRGAQDPLSARIQMRVELRRQQMLDRSEQLGDRIMVLREYNRRTSLGHNHSQQTKPF